jgi:hypothetical protein
MEAEVMAMADPELLIAWTIIAVAEHRRFLPRAKSSGLGAIGATRDEVPMDSMFPLSSNFYSDIRASNVMPPGFKVDSE